MPGTGGYGQETLFADLVSATPPVLPHDFLAAADSLQALAFDQANLQIPISSDESNYHM